MRSAPSFVEVAYLLMYGELPSAEQLAAFQESIHHHNMLHEQVMSFYRGFRRDAHPMAVMVGVVGALSAFYHDVMDIRNPDDRMRAAIRLVAKMPDDRGRELVPTPSVGRSATRTTGSITAPIFCK